MLLLILICVVRLILLLFLVSLYHISLDKNFLLILFNCLFLVENDTDMTQEVKTQMKAMIEAKFTGDDVLLAIKKFVEEKGMFYLYVYCVKVS